MNRAYAIGKIILIGEHAVVYGKPAIAIPFSGVSMESTVSSIKGEVLLECFDYKGLLSAAPEKFLGLTSVIKEVLKYLNKDLKDFKVTIESSIPVERGMGSSAAVSAATVRALFNYFDETLSDEVLSDFVNFSEKIVHGNPSGIDTAIVVNEKPLYYIKNEVMDPYDFSIDAHLLVADTGEMGMTKIAVTKVKDYIDAHADGTLMIDELGDLANESKQHLSRNDVRALADVMNKAQRHLKSLGVSNDNIDHLVNTALKEGALASKITGGGLGGCIITLCENEADAKRISDALISNGAKQTWLMDMNKGDQYEG